MAVSVEISPSALADAEEAFLYIQKDSSLNADEWYDGLVNAILSLENFPNRWHLKVKRLGERFVSYFTADTVFYLLLLRMLCKFCEFVILRGIGSHQMNYERESNSLLAIAYQ